MSRRHDAVTERFLRIARTLPETLLSGEDSNALEREILVGLGAVEDERLLGYYTVEGITAAFEAYGIFDLLRARGYQRFEISFDLQDFTHGLKILADDTVVADCRLRRSRGAKDPCFAEFQRHFVPELLDIEWLALHDPRQTFTADRPQLPGQQHPGSGIGHEVFVLLYISARRLGLHGIIEVPERFHNAVFYRRRTHFLDPVFHGCFEALCELVDHHPLSEVAWALEEDRVIDARTQAPIRWAPREQMGIIDHRLDDYFELPAWRRARNEARRACKPRIVPRPQA